MDKKQLKIELKKRKRELKKQYKQSKKQLKFSYKSEKTENKKLFVSEKKKLKEAILLENEHLVQNQIGEGVIISQKPEKISKRYSKPAPNRTVIEEIGNAVTHGIGAILAIIGFYFMLIHSDTPYEYAGAGVYCFGLFIMFAMSCLYHSFKTGSKVKNIFRHFDYMCIYLLIGATFAPILLCFIGGTFGLVFFIIQWVVIATGITLIGVFGPGRLKFIHFPLYFIIGWSGLLFIPQMIGTCLPLFLWILAGGVLYTIGMIPFALKKNVAHFIWHFFVFFGALAQWVGIYLYIYLV